MKEIKAEIVADSVDTRGNRITSYLLTYPRFIHSELMTHRMFSRNSASSRAIPFNKMIKMVEENPFIPIAWQKDHKGMQGTEYIVDENEINLAKIYWLNGAYQSMKKAKDLHIHGGVTKQLCNRMLEPYMWHTVLITATEYDNFFKLRCPIYKYKGKVYNSKTDLLNDRSDSFLRTMSELEWIQMSQSGAEIHIQVLAEAMWDARNTSTPQELKEGQWHIPFNDNIVAFEKNDNIKIATARCARLSYMTFDGEIDYEKDIKLHNFLLENRHMSPFEHCAKVMSEREYYNFTKGYEKESEFEGISLPYFDDKETGWCNNFKGFIQYRYLVEKNQLR